MLFANSISSDDMCCYFRALPKSLGLHALNPLGECDSHLRLIESEWI